MNGDDLGTWARPWSSLTPPGRWERLARATVEEALRPEPRSVLAPAPRLAYAAVLALLSLAAGLGAWAAASPAFRRHLREAWHRLSAPRLPPAPAPKALEPPKSARPAPIPAPARAKATPKRKAAAAIRPAGAARRERDRLLRERERERSRLQERLRSRPGPAGPHGRR